MKNGFQNVPDEYKLFVNNSEKCAVVKNVFEMCYSSCSDSFLAKKLQTCVLFLTDKITITEARACAFECHKYARSLTLPSEIAFARACGHAIATIHVKEHAIVSYDYFLKYKRLLQSK